MHCIKYAIAEKIKKEKELISMNFNNFFKFIPPKQESGFFLKDSEKNNKVQASEDEVSRSITVNLERLDKIFHRNVSYDVMLREFEIKLGRGTVKAFIYFIDGMVNSESVNEAVLSPLMVESEKLKLKEFEDVDRILLTQNQVKSTESIKDAVAAVCYGSCALFIEGSKRAFLTEVIGWKQRGVEEPQNEPAILGPHIAFNESIKTNTSIIRKMIRSENLVIDTVMVGKQAKTNCAVLYMENITNPSLVNEVKRRLSEIVADSVLSSGCLEQFIEEKSLISLPQILSTERPDRCARAIMEGRVAVIMDNSPIALIMPTTVFELLESAEDVYLRPIYSLLVKTVRLLGIFMSVYLPGIYIAAITYHTTVFPTGMLTTIMKASRKVPFDSITELVIMVIAFEIVREASSRVPGLLGSGLGIIGPLVLGQAAISANIVSPVMIIVFSIATIGSFATPNYSMAFSGRVLSIFYIALGSTAGFFGIAMGMFVQIMMWHTTKSFGVNMLSPFVPYMEMLPESVRTEPIWKKEKRPEYLKTKRPREQAHISRLWKENYFGANKKE